MASCSVRFGSADESPGYVTDMLTGSRALAWRARDGWSYWDALPRVRTMAIFGMGSRMRSRLEVDDAVPESVLAELRKIPVVKQAKALVF